MDDVACAPADESALPLTAANTLMGRLLRQFWHPVALGSDLGPGEARPLRVLSEDLTLYRGKSGAPHIIGGHCAHRCTVLHTGIVEDEQIRCMYHGWRFNAEGACTDIPAEKRARPNPPGVAGYPAREYAGLIFAYMGEAPAPEFDLPRKDVFEDAARSTLVKREIWDCNWFQQIENSMDAVHLGFAHMWGVAGQFGASVSGGGLLPDLKYEETSSGIRQIATRPNNNVRISDWTFPNNNHIVVPGATRGAAWAHVSVWATPIDDRRTMRYRLYSTDENDPAVLEQARRDQDFQPLDHVDKLFRGDLDGLSEQAIISAQDYVAVRGQGEICDRSRENLSTSDAGIAFLRRVFLREMEAIRLGRARKSWSRLSEAVHLPPPPSRATE